MQSLNLPPYKTELSEKNGKMYIYDSFRRKNVAFTPEEWVRQHFVNYLVTEKSYPSELIANEVCIDVNSTSKRCDTVIYDKFLNPLVIIEYKAPEVAITEDVFEQISMYNSTLRVPYLIVSNGLTHYCCFMDYKDMKCVFLENIPEYRELDER